jgi:hypothetical protein
MNKKIKKQKRKKRLKKLKHLIECYNDQDPITLEDFNDSDEEVDIVSIQLPSKESKQQQQHKGECYNRDTLHAYWKYYLCHDLKNQIYLWNSRDPESVDLDENKIVFKLPISGVWITRRAARKIVQNRRRNTFKLKSLGQKYIGGVIFYQSSSSSVWSQLQEVYDVFFS